MSGSTASSTICTSEIEKLYASCTLYLELLQSHFVQLDVVKLAGLARLSVAIAEVLDAIEAWALKAGGSVYIIVCPLILLSTPAGRDGNRGHWVTSCNMHPYFHGKTPAKECQCPLEVAICKVICPWVLSHKLGCGIAFYNQVLLTSSGMWEINPPPINLLVFSYITLSSEWSSLPYKVPDFCLLLQLLELDHNSLWKEVIHNLHPIKHNLLKQVRTYSLNLVTIIILSMNNFCFDIINSP